jgi:hypothetical protein
MLEITVESLSWLWRLVAGVSPRRPGFDVRPPPCEICGIATEFLGVYLVLVLHSLRVRVKVGVNKNGTPIRRKGGGGVVIECN